MGFLWLKFTKKMSMVFLWLTIGFKNPWLYHGYGLIWVENPKPDPWRTLVSFQSDVSKVRSMEIKSEVSAKPELISVFFYVTTL